MGVSGFSGPCKQADSLNVLLPSGGQGLALAVNFGLLLRPGEGAGWQVVCEETYGGVIPERIQMDRGGRIFIPTTEGLYISASSDGCRWDLSGGAIAKMPVWDLAFDPVTSDRIWALGADDARVLYLSVDGGKTFAARKTFDADLHFYRVTVAASDPKTIYVTGYAAKVPFVMAWSDDEGETWTVDATGGNLAGARSLVQFLGVDPLKPQTVFMSVSNPDAGDEIWKSTEHGAGAKKILTLLGNEYRWGFAFGAASTVFVAGREILEGQGTVKSRLYVSHDGGGTWADPVASGATGPRYRCLGFRDGKLYACGGGRAAGDDFLLGESGDEGKTWVPVIRMADITGTNACNAETCRATSVWLCETEGICSPGLDGGREAPVEPGGGDAPICDGGAACPHGGGGCGCRMGGSEEPATVALYVVALVVVASVHRGKSRRTA